MLILSIPINERNSLRPSLLQYVDRACSFHVECAQKLCMHQRHAPTVQYMWELLIFPLLYGQPWIQGANKAIIERPAPCCLPKTKVKKALWNLQKEKGLMSSLKRARTCALKEKDFASVCNFNCAPIACPQPPSFSNSLVLSLIPSLYLSGLQRESHSLYFNFIK